MDVLVCCSSAFRKWHRLRDVRKEMVPCVLDDGTRSC